MQNNSMVYSKYTPSYLKYDSNKQVDESIYADLTSVNSPKQKINSDAKSPIYPNPYQDAQLPQPRVSLKTEPEEVLNITQMVLGTNLYDEIKLLTFAHRDEALKLSAKECSQKHHVFETLKHDANLSELSVIYLHPNANVVSSLKKYKENPINRNYRLDTEIKTSGIMDKHQQSQIDEQRYNACYSMLQLKLKDAQSNKISITNQLNELQELRSAYNQAQGQKDKKNKLLLLETKMGQIFENNI